MHYQNYFRSFRKQIPTGTQYISYSVLAQNEIDDTAADQLGSVLEKNMCLEKLGKLLIGFGFKPNWGSRRKKVGKGLAD